MSRKALSMLPDALAKSDYFRTRAPSKSPNRRPPRKGALRTETATEVKSAAATNGIHLPQIRSSSGSENSDKALNGDPMTGEVTISFVDYRKDANTIKRVANANPMHNVKIIQYIGQGKGGSRVAHEFWMQSETSARFPVAQQAISSRFQLNFGFYLDGQFFQRLTVCCLHKLRTHHSTIGNKFVHFKVVDCTNEILCFRCKGHEFMLHSFKKSSASPQQRSASMPRPVPEKPPVPSPDAADHKNLRVNGTSAAKRSRSSSRPRNHESLQRTTTKTLVKADTLKKANGVLHDTKVAAVVNGDSKERQISSGQLSREDALENYCEDRMSPVPGDTGRDTYARNSPEPAELQPLSNNTETVIRDAEKEDGPYAKMIAHDDASDGTVVKETAEDTDTKTIIRNAEQEDGPYATMLAQAGGGAENETTVKEDVEDSPTVSRDVDEEEGPLAEMVAHDNNANEVTGQTFVRDTSVEDGEQKAQNEITGQTESSETVVRNADSATDKPNPENSTFVRESSAAENSTEVRDTKPDNTHVRAEEPPETETSVREGGEQILDEKTDTFVRDEDSLPADSTHVRDTPADHNEEDDHPHHRNVDTAEDMIELDHRKSSISSNIDEITGQRLGGRESVAKTEVRETTEADEITGQMPSEAIFHDKEHNPQSSYLDRSGEKEREKETATQVRDAEAHNVGVPSLAKEDPVAFAWPGTEPSAQTHVREENHSLEDKNFKWPDAKEQGNGIPSRHVSVDIVDDADAAPKTQTDTTTFVREINQEQSTTTKVSPSQDAAPADEDGTRKESRAAPVNAEELIEQLGYTEEKPKTATKRLSRSSTLGNSIDSVGSGTEGETEAERHARRGKKTHEKLPATPHNAEELIEQLGYDPNEPEPKPIIP